MQNIQLTPYTYLWFLASSTIFVLAFISGVISLKSKEKSFLYYFIYAFFLLLYIILKIPFDFPLRDAFYASKFAEINWYLQVIYNCIYFLFFIHFVDLKSHNSRLNKLIKKTVFSIFSISTICFAISLLINNTYFFSFYFAYIFTPITFSFAIFVLIKVMSLPGKLKYFIVFGSGIYISLAVTALILSKVKYTGTPLFYFIVGIFIEQIVFALGLSYRVKKIYENLLWQYKENEKIKVNQNIQLSKALKEKEKEIKKLMQNAAQEKIKQINDRHKSELQGFQLKSLRSQMNPHFIFNALNSIKVFFIENNKKEAVFYLNKFSKLIRRILESSRIESHSLKEELEFIKLYLNIENIRFEEKIQIEIKCDPHVPLAHIEVPPLLLQPFVENAIWHGLMLKETNRKLTLKIHKNKKHVVLLITDNGIGRKKRNELQQKGMFNDKSVGLKLTENRLNYFNKKMGFSYTFSIKDLVNERNKPSGTKVCFLFNKATEYNL